MSNGQDQFFEEEEAQLAQPAKARPAKAATAQKPSPKASAFTTTKPTRPPSFALVVAIAAVALLLGFSIGYFVALSTAGQRPSSSAGIEPIASAPSSATQADGTDTAQSTLPSGHPDLSSFYNDDGSINEEALAAYRAQNGA